jgi:hypothetical protein
MRRPSFLSCVHTLAHYQQGEDGFQKGVLRRYGSQDASAQSSLHYQQHQEWRGFLTNLQIPYLKSNQTQPQFWRQ